MDQRADEKLEEFTEKLMQDFSNETPSIDFTTKVMSNVTALYDLRVTTYEPLISKKIWILLGVFIFSVFAYLIYNNKRVENSWLSSYDIKPIQDLNVFNLPEFEISSVGMLAIMGFTFFMSIQIFLLKNHFAKRLA
ncbi:hypothetical protein JQC67_17405 [Aurantibacter crassamenti]|uniref:hypothetical protein n=1 Tax=Aurantibacter crassamenti TaxID=1837375 RepID=UPI00193A37A7|nr:hypothetical protein [Aurantibacter crassamenti]MBM1107936.1 hypothetical protein [Aurantibacter crassamenti]